ncbi:MAG: hypothetical protein RBT06_09595 [Smithellaceae bacterium]|nr:hypothetical protein [Smithellaceae bacterium]
MQNGRIDHDDVGHGQKNGDSGRNFRLNICPVSLKVKCFVEKTFHQSRFTKTVFSRGTYTQDLL